PTGGDSNPVLDVDKNILDFGETNTSQFLTISNSGSGTLHFSIEVPSEGWISVSQREGNITNEPVGIDVRIDREKAPVGQQEVIVVITAEQGGRREVIVRANIRRVAQLSLSPLSLNFGETSSQQQVTLRNDGGESLSWSATSPQEWLSIAPASGSLAAGDQQAVTVTIDRTKLGSGSNQGAVDFTSGGGSTSVTVLATGSAFGSLSASPTTLDFGTRNARETLEIRRIGGSGTMEWTVEASDAWIDPKTTSGSLLIGEARTIFIEVKRENLDPAAYQGSLVFRWAGGATEVTVAMRVADEPVLSLSDESLDVGAEETANFSIINAGSGSLNWQITETAAWLELDPTFGETITIPRTITGTIDRTGMTAGQYDVVIRVDSDGGSLDLPLVMEVPLPTIEITQGPAEGELLTSAAATFSFRALNAYGPTSFSTRLDAEEWTDWSETTTVAYEYLEESSLIGPHLFQVRVRSDAGESEALVRTFEVDAIQGPALRLSPKAIATSTGQTIEIDIVAEEVENILAARVVLDFDAAELELQKVEAIDSFLGQNGGSLVAPEPEIDNAGGRLDLSIGVAGGSRPGVDGTGILARLTFRAKRSGVAEISLSADTALRDPDNSPISIRTEGTTITVQ
ncbi:MAG: hypothetical protein HOC74_39390, partial [Gemmatimonadetes bacterium]|nr:hypothetical protein [Gemmatimonadota bacterium]